MVNSVLRPQAMPIEPPPLTSMHSLPPHGLHQSASPSVDISPKEPVSESYCLTQSTTSSPSPKYSNNPEWRRPKSQTSSRSSVTPLQAHAASFLHSSPVPPVLPVSKWSSESIKKRKRLSEERARKISPCQLRESLTLRKSRMDARKFQGQPPKSPVSASTEAYKPHQPRHLISHSRREFFPLNSEDPSTDSSVSSQSGRSQRSLSDSARSSTTPSDTSVPVANDEDYCKAKCLAPLRLLQAPVLQGPVSAFSPSRTTTNDKEPRAIPPMPTASGLSRPSTAPSDSSATVADDELCRKAKSLALLRLLQAPVLQGLVSVPSPSRPTARENGSRTFPPTPNPSGPSKSMVSPAAVLPSIPCPSIVPSSCPHSNKQKSLETAPQSRETTQLLAPYNTSDAFSELKEFCDLAEFGMVCPRIEKRPLSLGQRAILMEGYLSRGIDFKSRPCVTSSQFSRDLDHASLTSEHRARLLDEFIQRNGNTCSCKSSSNPPPFSSSVENPSP
ncbi:hypothetical protein MMC22_009073 [Lobaria immixta]|nr:hypothetical protein [Lobaria immixta]